MAASALTLAKSSCDTLPTAITAADVCRGVARWLWRAGCAPLAEVPLANGRRADLMAVCERGRITIIEVKVSLADLRQDQKWPDYLDYCDRFFWAAPAGFPLAAFEAPDRGPERAGLLVADRYDAAEVRPAPWVTLPPARRKAATLLFARRAAARVLRADDPEVEVF